MTNTAEAKMKRFDSEESFKKAIEKKLALFVGAGFSVLSYNREDEQLPIANELIKKLREKFPSVNSFEDLSRASTLLDNTCREEFYEFLVEQFTVEKYDSLYKILPKLNITDIFTTNIDDLIYKIYDESKDKRINTTSEHGTSYDESVVNFSPLHGSVKFDKKGFIFSKIKISSAYNNNGDDWTNLRNSIMNEPILFWGWSAEDADVIAGLYSGTKNIDRNENKWILLHEPTDADVQYYEALDFKIIVGSTEDFLKYLNSISLSTKGNNSVLKKDFLKEYSIPDSKKIISSPLVNFFKGEEPQWSNIISDEIPITHYYSKICDILNEGKNLFVIGIPASGKTTLMMQLMYKYETDLNKHFLKAPTVDDVKLYIKRLDDAKALVFVDDCFRDYLSVLELANNKNIQFICCDRDYAYEGQVYRLHGKINFKTIDVTEINDKDARKIVDKIPSDIKKEKTSIKKTKDKTIFSILSYNTKGRSFEKRFTEMIGQFYKDNPIATELFVMICYVHSCGVPTSVDMIFSYLGDLINSYKDVYKYLKEVGNIIKECDEDSFDSFKGSLEDQDYYQSRSKFFAERILDNLPVEPNVLNKVLMKFVSNIAAFQICRFDYFRRKGFDAKLVNKAFPKTEEGKEYYEKCLVLDDSEYIYQQAALYLSKKKEFSEAFQWIERARNSSKNIFSIESTHAIILFDANIDVEDDNEKNVREILTGSLEQLKKCYKEDRRKAIHVSEFAQRVLRFYDRYGNDEQSIEYLKIANEMCEQEIQKTDDYGTKKMGELNKWKEEIAKILSKIL